MSHRQQQEQQQYSYSELNLRRNSSDSTRHALLSVRTNGELMPLAGTEPRTKRLLQNDGELSPPVHQGSSYFDSSGSTYFREQHHALGYGTVAGTDSIRYSAHEQENRHALYQQQQRQHQVTSQLPQSRQQDVQTFVALANGVSPDHRDDDSSQAPSVPPPPILLQQHQHHPLWWKVVTDWLSRDWQYNTVTHTYYFDDDESWFSVARLVRTYLYNPLSPEFDSLKLFCWGIVIGLVMGLYCSVWKWLIEKGVDILWETIPEMLYEWGLFTDANGSFPLYHYIWIVPALFGGILSWIHCILPTKIPDQNEWIKNVHSRGVQTSDTFVLLFILSTMGMWSGLSLGPELPLVLTAGMAGSWLGILTNQSMLHARVLNLTAAGAAVGGFFGFPAAGALFVLELPHREGLQYFEALSPGIVSSIVAVLTNRIVTGDEVTGYFRYPFLTLTLPSIVFTCAVFYGLYGYVIGKLYCDWVKLIKNNVHDWFHAPHYEENDHHEASKQVDEKVPLVSGATTKTPQTSTSNHRWWVLHDEPKRAAVVGTLAGALVGIIGIFVPHIMFWGEAQLQNLIDKGRTPLPVFGGDGEHVEALTAHALCMIDPHSASEIKAGFGIGCSLLISITKTIAIGLSLGTGIIGGHFWGPLYVGCAASHLLTDVVHLIDQYLPIGPCKALAAYPCLVILCTMGAAHVVTFRAHVAIMLILTLTISGFDPESENSPFQVAGDYSAVFPLLVVSVFLSLYCSRGTVFYATQRPRGDITAIAEVLCRPGQEGAPLVVGYEHSTEELSTDSPGSYYRSESSSANMSDELEADSDFFFVRGSFEPTQDEIEKQFESTQQVYASGSRASSRQVWSSPAMPNKGVCGSTQPPLSDARLNELLGIHFDAQPVATPLNTGRSHEHRRIKSAPLGVPLAATQPRSSTPNAERRGSGSRDRLNSQGSQGSSRGLLVEVTSFGHIEDHQPSLLDQARARAAPTTTESMHRSIPSGGPPGLRAHRRTHSRNQSGSSIGSSIGSFGLDTLSEVGGALLIYDLQNSFSEVITETVIPRSIPPRPLLPRSNNNRNNPNASNI